MGSALRGPLGLSSCEAGPGTPVPTQFFFPARAGTLSPTCPVFPHRALTRKWWPTRSPAGQPSSGSFSGWGTSKPVASHVVVGACAFGRHHSWIREAEVDAPPRFTSWVPERPPLGPPAAPPRLHHCHLRCSVRVCCECPQVTPWASLPWLRPYFPTCERAGVGPGRGPARSLGPVNA